MMELIVECSDGKFFHVTYGTLSGVYAKEIKGNIPTAKVKVILCPENALKKAVLVPNKGFLIYDQQKIDNGDSPDNSKLGIITKVFEIRVG